MVPVPSPGSCQAGAGGKPSCWEELGLPKGAALHYKGRSSLSPPPAPVRSVIVVPAGERPVSELQLDTGAQPEVLMEAGKKTPAPEKCLLQGLRAYLKEHLATAPSRTLESK